MLDRDEAGAKQVAADVGGDYLVADLSDGTSIDALGLGTDVHADILVNNAGVQHVAPVEDFDPERFAFIQRLMLEAPFRLARALLPGHVRPRLGPARARLLRARPPRLAVQVGLRRRPSTASRASPR